MSNSFSFNIIDGENGYKYYLVPEGTTLYRGDTTLYPNFQLPNSTAFFSTDSRFVKHYVLVFRFKTKRPLKLRGWSFGRTSQRWRGKKKSCCFRRLRLAL